jgi:hypothetical protein
LNVYSILAKVAIVIVIFSIIDWVIGGSIGLLLGLLFGCFSLLLVSMLTYENDKKGLCLSIKFVSGFPKFKLLFLVFVNVLSVISFYFISSVQSQIYILPENIAIANWLRLIFAILMTTFIPGYMLIDMVDTNRTIGLLKKVLFSYILSVFSTFLLGYIIIFSGNSIDQMGTFGITVFNFSILLLYAFFFFKRVLYSRQTQEADKAESIHIIGVHTLYNVAFWILMACLIIVLTYLRYGPQLISDQWDYHGIALTLESIKLPQDSAIFPSAIWFLGTYQAMLFGSSGVPSVNAYNSLGFLNIIPFLAFFVLVKSFFRNHAHVNGIAALSTFFVFFTSGFGWIYTIRDSLVGNVPLSQVIYTSWTKTYDILTPNSYIVAGHPDITAPLLLIGLPAMFVLFELSIAPKNDINNKLKYLLIIVTVVLGYLGHTETIIMIVAVAIISLTTKDGLKTLISLFAAFLLIFVIDFSSPSRYYSIQGIIIGGHYVSFPILLLSSFAGLMGVYLSLRRARKANSLIRLRLMAKRLSSSVSAKYGILLLSSTIFCVYLLAFVIWANVQADFNIWQVFGYDGSVPWYFYPIRLGVVGFAALGGVLYWLLSKKWNLFVQLFPFFVWALITIVVTPYYLEYRLVKQFYIPICAIAGLAIVNAASWASKSSLTVALVDSGERVAKSIPKIPSIHINGKYLVAVGLIVIIIASIGSNLLSIRAVKDSDPSVISVLPWRSPFTEEELMALTWLRVNINPVTDTVLYLPDGRNLRSEVEAIGGAWAGLSRQFAPFFEVSRADDFFDLCYKMHVNYLYLNWKDRIILDSDPKYANSFVKQLLNYLPVAFNNSKVTIFKFPSFAPPLKSSSTALVLPSTTLPVTTVSLTNLSYAVVDENDPSKFNYNTLILPNYPSSEELGNYTDWISQGGHLVTLSLPPDPALARSYGASNGTFYGFSPLSGNWSAIGNEIFASSSGTLLSNETIAGDYEVTTYVKVVQELDPDNHLGLLFNYQDSNNYYYAFLRNTTFVLFKDYNGNATEVYHAQLQRSNGIYQKLTIKVALPVISFYVDDVYVGEYHDQQSIDSGRLGLFAYNVMGQFRAINVTMPPSEYVYVNGIAVKNTTIDIPEIEVPFFNETMLTDKTISIDAYYTLNGEKVAPFAFTEGKGNGSINSIDFSSLFNFMETSSDIAGERLLFSKLGEILGSIELNLPQQTISNVSVQPICYVRGTINSTGNVVLNTDSFWFTGQKPLFGQIDLTNATKFEITEGGGVPPKSSPFNSTIIEYQTEGLTKTTFQTSSIMIKPSDSGTYATVEIPDNFRMTTHLADGATLNFTLLIDGSIVKLSVLGGSISLDIFDAISDPETSNYTTLEISAKYPDIQLTGTTSMEQAYLITGPRSVLVFGYPTVISGTTIFQIENVDQGVIRLSNFLLDGKLSYQKPEKMWNEWNIPWMQVLTSEYTWFFVVLALVVIFLFKKTCFSSKNNY